MYGDNFGLRMGEDAATQCDVPNATRSTMCVLELASKTSQCATKMVSQSTQTAVPERAEDAVQLTRHQSDREGPATIGSKCNTLCGQEYLDEKCPTSGYLVSSPASSHLGKLSGKTLHKCSICSKCFDFKSFLTRHFRIHTGERPFHCDYCGRNFEQSSNLLRHIRSTHTGDKKHQCQLCPMAFTERCVLIRHIRSHNGERPFQCDLCSKVFSQAYNLKKHKKKEHNGKTTFS